MIKSKMEETLNKQIVAELYSAYLYASMGAYFHSQNLKGCAQWMYIQTQEELTHGQKLINFIIEKGGRVLLGAIDGPPTEWDSPLAAFEAAYAHEQMVTGLFDDLVDLAITEKDHATNNMLKWYVDEQVEEESAADEVVQMIKLAGDAPGALFMIDRELGARVFTGGALMAGT